MCTLRAPVFGIRVDGDCDRLVQNLHDPFKPIHQALVRTTAFGVVVIIVTSARVHVTLVADVNKYEYAEIGYA